MFNRLRRRWRPESYQGSLNSRQYFEGWYYKVVDEAEDNVIAIIPGVSFGDKSAHAFIQILDGTRLNYQYHRFNMDEFSYSRDGFRIEVGSSTFGTDGIDLRIQGTEGDVVGSLDFADLRPWPRRIWSPGSMGALGLVPGIPCYHHVLSLGHRVSGQLSRGNRVLDFNGGRGYTEKNWGRSFPRSWVWLQSNHFEEPSTCFVLAFARMNYHSRLISGLTCGLAQGERHYEFCTSSGGRMTGMAAWDGRVRLSLQNPRYKLEVDAVQTTPTKMLFPHLGGMTGSVFESLKSSIEFSLIDRKGGKNILEGTGRCAGVEFGEGAEGVAG